MKNYPYIGITGFMRSYEVKLILDTFVKSRPLIKNSFYQTLFQGENDRILMVGVLASVKTLYGKTNKWPNRYPKIEDIKNIFLCNPSHLLNLVHYSTGHIETLYPQLALLTEIAGPNCDGFQLNIAWPDADEMSVFKKRYPYKKIVLQVGRKALDIANAVINLESHLSSYEGLIDYVLFDPSGGRGEPFDTGEMHHCLKVAQKCLKGVGIGVAGGLSAETLDNLQPILGDFPDISIDAESRLRNENDHLVLSKAEFYIKKAFKILKRD